MRKVTNPTEFRKSVIVKFSKDGNKTNTNTGSQYRNWYL